MPLLFGSTGYYSEETGGLTEENINNTGIELALHLKEQSC